MKKKAIKLNITARSCDRKELGNSEDTQILNMALVKRNRVVKRKYQSLLLFPQPLKVNLFPPTHNTLPHLRPKLELFYYSWPIQTPDNSGIGTFSSSFFCHRVHILGKNLQVGQKFPLAV